MPRAKRSAAARAPLPDAPPTRMAATDAFFWWAETVAPAYRPIIAGLYLLDRAPEPGALEAAVWRAVEAVPRLRQRVVEAPLGIGLPEWAWDAHFDPAYHLRHVSLPAPGGQRELLDLAGALFATPLDRARPLWEATWIDGREGGGSALLLKMHHSLVDGVGSVAILDALTATTSYAARKRPRRANRAAPPREPSAAERVASIATEQAQGALRLAGRALGALAHPGEAIDAAARAARGVRAMVADAARPPVHDPLAVPGSGLSRRLDVAEVSLDRLRKIRGALGVSINDVVLAALTGALHAYHHERRVSADELVCLVPMNLRGKHERDALGNRVGMFNVLLPVGEADAARCLARITEQTRAAKADRRGAAAPLLVELLTLVPGALLRPFAGSVFGRVNVACTNVPGVPDERWMAGARVTAVHPFASVVEGTPLVMALLSYAGRMEIGLDTDPEAIPDPHRITELFLDALGELESLGNES